MSSSEAESRPGAAPDASEHAQPKQSRLTPAGYRWPRSPLVAGLIHNAAACRLLALVMTAHFALMQLGLAGWRCPILVATSRPCPGCGLSRSMTELVQGNLEQAFAYHAFGPVAGLAIGLMLASALLSSGPREVLARFVQEVEIATGVSHLSLALFLIYWVARMVTGRGAILALA